MKLCHVPIPCNNCPFRRIIVVDKVVTQSSDSEFHCLAITLFYKRAA